MSSGLTCSQSGILDRYTRLCRGLVCAAYSWQTRNARQDRRICLWRLQGGTRGNAARRRLACDRADDRAGSESERVGPTVERSGERQRSSLYVLHWGCRGPSLSPSGEQRATSGGFKAGQRDPGECLVVGYATAETGEVFRVSSADWEVAAVSQPLKDVRRYSVGEAVDNTIAVAGKTSNSIQSLLDLVAGNAVQPGGQGELVSRTAVEGSG